jgi:hypothetical protein
MMEFLVRQSNRMPADPESQKLREQLRILLATHPQERVAEPDLIASGDQVNNA